MKKNEPRTRTQLAGVCGVSRPTVALWRARPDWPGDAADDASLKRYAAQMLERARKAQGGENAELKKAKLEKQIRLLSAQAERAESEAGSASLRLQRERNEVVQLEHHKTVTLAVLGLSLSLWETAINSIAAKRKDAALLQELQDAMSRARARVLEDFDCDEKRFETMEQQNNTESKNHD
jgi:adenylate kinase